MYNKFLHYIRKEQLFNHSHRLLLAVSGGPDSVVLAHLINQTNNAFAIAHCNFHLRGTDSDEDEKFVNQMAQNFGVELFATSFDTIGYAAENGISIEMAARELRYNWFEQLRNNHGFDYILTGHHLGDVLETFMLNLSRGTGIRGLSGISNKAGHIVRPLLFATRADIEHYINEKKLPYRIDASNDDTSIKRNKVRHQLLPLFEELNPSFRNNLQKTIHYLKQTEIIYAERIKQIRNDIVINKQGVVRIDIDKLKKQVAGNTILYELLLPYGFNSDVACEIFHALDGRSGAKFYSDCYRAVIDRNAILLTRIPQNDNQIFYISDDQSKITEPLQLDFDIEYVNEKTKISGVSKIAMLDYDKLSFPLILRKWRHGEYFKPLGMNGLKKISDFFIDQKISIPEKENTWILYSGNQVVWIIGHRIDDRFKISPATRKIFKITVE